MLSAAMAFLKMGKGKVKQLKHFIFSSIKMEIKKLNKTKLLHKGKREEMGKRRDGSMSESGELDLVSHRVANRK